MKRHGHAGAQAPGRTLRIPLLNAAPRRELDRFVRQPGGFGLGLATYDHGGTRDLEIRRLSDAVAVAAVDLTRLDLKASPEERQLLARLREHLRRYPAAGGRRPVVMVVGLEAALDYRLPDDEGLALFAHANLDRDTFAALGEATVVLWLDATATAAFERAAPDLWPESASRFVFRAAKRPQPVHERLEVRPPASPHGGRFRAVSASARIRTIEARLEQIERDGEALTVPSGPALSIDLALAYHALGDVVQAGRRLAKAQEMAILHGDRKTQALALASWALVHADLGELDRAERYHQEALALVKEIRDPALEARLYQELGADAYRADRFEAAQSHFERAAALTRQLGDEPGAAAARLGLALVAVAGSGESEASEDSEESRTSAAQLAEDALATWRQLGDREGEALTSADLGVIYAAGGRLEEALRSTDSALGIYRQLGDQLGENWALTNLSRLHAAVGQAERAQAARAAAAEIEHALLEASPRPLAVGDGSP